MFSGFLGVAQAIVGGERYKQFLNSGAENSAWI